MMLKDKIAVITGGGSGIGRAIAVTFAQHQAHSIILEKCCDAAGDTAREIRQAGGSAEAVCADVSSLREVAAAFAEIAQRTGRIDILVNCAGVFVRQDAVTLEEADWDLCFDVNLKGAWLCCKHAVPLMPAGGSIIAIGSTHSMRAQGKAFPYGVTKGGLVALTRSLAVDFGRQGIRANIIVPGLVTTPLTRSIYENGQSPSFEELVARQPLPVRIQPEDVAHAALFLASDLARCITGTTLFVDGGRTISAGIEN